MTLTPTGTCNKVLSADSEWGAYHPHSTCVFVDTVTLDCFIFVIFLMHTLSHHFPLARASVLFSYYHIIFFISFIIMSSSCLSFEHIDNYFFYITFRVHLQYSVYRRVTETFAFLDTMFLTYSCMKCVHCSNSFYLRCFFLTYVSTIGLIRASV